MPSSEQTIESGDTESNESSKQPEVKSVKTTDELSDNFDTSEKLSCSYVGNVDVSDEMDKVVNVAETDR